MGGEEEGRGRRREEEGEGGSGEREGEYEAGQPTEHCRIATELQPEYEAMLIEIGQYKAKLHMFDGGAKIK